MNKKTQTETQKANIFTAITLVGHHALNVVSTNKKYAAIAADVVNSCDIENVMGDEYESDLLVRHPEWDFRSVREFNLTEKIPAAIVKKMLAVVEANQDSSDLHSCLIVHIAIEIQRMIIEEADGLAAGRYVRYFLLFVGTNFDHSFNNKSSIALAIEIEETTNWDLSIDKENNEIADGLLGLLRVRDIDAAATRKRHHAAQFRVHEDPTIEIRAKAIMKARAIEEDFAQFKLEALDLVK